MIAPHAVRCLCGFNEDTAASGHRPCASTLSRATGFPTASSLKPQRPTCSVCKRPAGAGLLCTLYAGAGVLYAPDTGEGIVIATRFPLARFPLAHARSRTTYKRPAGAGLLIATLNPGRRESHVCARTITGDAVGSAPRPCALGNRVLRLSRRLHVCGLGSCMCAVWAAVRFGKTVGCCAWPKTRAAPARPPPGKHVAAGTTSQFFCHARSNCPGNASRSASSLSRDLAERLVFPAVTHGAPALRVRVLPLRREGGGRIRMGHREVARDRWPTNMAVRARCVTLHD